MGICKVERIGLMKGISLQLGLTGKFEVRLKSISLEGFWVKYQKYPHLVDSHILKMIKTITPQIGI